MKFARVTLLALIIPFLIGCVPKWSHVDTVEVRESTKRIGVVSSDLYLYHAPRAITFPTGTDGKLVLKFEKILKNEVEYNTPIFKQKVLKRKIRLSEEHRENIFKEITEGDSILLKIFAIIGLPINILLSPLWDHFEGEPKTQTKVLKIPDSDSVEVFHDIEFNSVPAAGIEVHLIGVGKTVTSKEGIASFVVDSGIFDQGVILENKSYKNRYLIKREKYTKTYTYVAPWRDAAQLASNASTAYLIFKKTRNVMAIGGGPYAIAGIVIVEIATGLFVGYVIDVLATSKRTDEFYRWKIHQM